MKEMEKRKIRSEKYDCDGKCYPDFGCCCPRVDYCPETRTKEFLGTIAAIGLFIGTGIMIIVVFIMAITGNLK